MNELDTLWRGYLERLDVAFQPIVNIHTGKTFGVEALLRGVEGIGFASIFALFDAAYESGLLYSFDLALRERVIDKFTHIPDHRKYRLFINLDNRIFEMGDYTTGNTEKLLAQHGLGKSTICFELSERHEIVRFDRLESAIEHYGGGGYGVVIDDFGTGYSGYKLFYHCAPDIIKVDRFFISGVDCDPKKKTIVRNMVWQATMLGVRVVAEGVEIERELQVCREIGFNWVQGYYVQKPTLDPLALRRKYGRVRQSAATDRRQSSLKTMIKERLIAIEPVHIEAKMIDVLERMKANRQLPLLPVVDDENVPLGILHESELKQLVYTPYGRSLLQNESAEGMKLKKYVQRCAVADIHSDIDTIIELFSEHDDADGILITKNFRYIGYLNARAIIEMIHSRSLACARDQNPLTRLPGNHVIEQYMVQTLGGEAPAVMVYFDFNDFKPFNDEYGFRNGDRVIQLFADLLRKRLPASCFKGHIGGDDFFVGCTADEPPVDDALLLEMLAQFEEEVVGFYTPEDRARGHIIAKDRQGTLRPFALLSVSAVAVRYVGHSRDRSVETLQRVFAEQKKVAKRCRPAYNALTIL